MLESNTRWQSLLSPGDFIGEISEFQGHHIYCTHYEGQHHACWISVYFLLLGMQQEELGLTKVDGNIQDPQVDRNRPGNDNREI